MVPLHDSAAPHVVEADACWQPPLTQTPVLPHGGLAAQLPGSVLPLGTFEHVPAAPVPLHDWQAGQEPVVQQTPSVQLLLVHWLPPPHASPNPFFATQLPGADAFPVQ